MKSELEKGFLIGLFEEFLFINYRVSFIGVVIGRYFKKFWLIVDFFLLYDSE